MWCEVHGTLCLNACPQGANTTDFLAFQLVNCIHKAHPMCKLVPDYMARMNASSALTTDMSLINDRVYSWLIIGERKKVRVKERFINVSTVYMSAQFTCFFNFPRPYQFTNALISLSQAITWICAQSTISFTSRAAHHEISTFLNTY